MRLLPFLVLLVIVAVCAAKSLEAKKEKLLSKMLKKGSTSSRNKRSLYEFYLMISCETGRDWQDYNGYGCWCGKGGYGKIVDDLDRCCYVHDHCYSAAEESGKCTWPGQIYWDSYWRIGCSDCDASQNTACEQALCECDRDAARCFAANNWDQQYDDYSRDQC